MKGGIKVLVAVGFTALLSSAANAKPYKWCIDVSADMPNCQFTTLKQCRASASGTGRECSINPKVLFGKKAARTTAQ